MIGLKFVRFLETKEEQNLLLTVLKSRAEAEIQKNGLHVQTKYQLKLQVLQQEEVVLNKAGQEYIEV